MSTTQILIATTSPLGRRDIKAEVIAASVATRVDMKLVINRVLNVGQLRAAMDQVEPNQKFAVILVGEPPETRQHSLDLLESRADVVVLQVDIVGADVRIDLRDPSLESMLTALRELADHMSDDRMRAVRLEPRHSDLNLMSYAFAGQPPLLAASTSWLDAILRKELSKTCDDPDGVGGMALPRDAILQSFESNYEPSSDEEEASQALEDILCNGPIDEPLQAIYHRLKLSTLEFKLLLMALAPELEARFQRCYGFLQDDLSRRHGSLVFYCSLLGNALDLRMEMQGSHAIHRWRLLDNVAPSADELVRIDGSMVQWILGDPNALLSDPRVRRVSRCVPWMGAKLINRNKEKMIAEGLNKWFKPTKKPTWKLLTGNQAASWRALLEAGNPYGEIIRIDALLLRDMDRIECEETAIRVARAAILTGWPLVIDAGEPAGMQPGLLPFLTVLNRFKIRAAVICLQAATVIEALGDSRAYISSQPVLSPGAKYAAAVEAGCLADTMLSEQEAKSLFSRFPLEIDRLEVAGRLAGAAPSLDQSPQSRVDRFLKACQQIATEGLSKLSESVDPTFQLEQVSLPDDQKSQLDEMVAQVRFSSQVLDQWKFGLQLPYGRGVSALFYGPSGTGKTMAAMGIANKLKVPLLRLDLSRVVSKYIGDTEKNIDQVFADAETSGGSILIDEADALLGKRSDVKDAHDRYANIEVAYLLQRMEAFTGLVIMTTNMRQNLDSAFVRRLRFIIEFPKPSMKAREEIWRLCLPTDSHELQDSAFLHLARRVDVTGGHIRQITLRAAFLAAAQGELIRMQHIVIACRAEYAKLGLPAVELDASLDRRVA